MKSSTCLQLRSLVLLFLLSCLGAACLFAQDENPPSMAARLSVVDGKVSFQPAGDTDWSQAVLNYTVTTGDRLYADQGGRAELETGPYAVRIGQTTDLTIANLNDQFFQLGLAQGTVRLSTYQIPPGNSVEVDTPNGALLIEQPGDYRVDTYSDAGQTVVTVNSGSLRVTGGGVDLTVQGGQAVQLTGSGPVELTYVTVAAPDDFDQWCMSRDQQLESAGAAQAQYVNGSVPGTEVLPQYGQWESVPAYGPVWYPNNVAAGWVPYSLGSWVWVEPWGWTWVSTEPWGFAPFHYGRWAHIGRRWGWVPGPVAVAPVYAPALVAFVGGSGFSVAIGLGESVAWFPLGPADPYFPWYHCRNDYVRRVNITNVRNVTNIVNVISVTNVNNVHYQYRDIATTAVPAPVFRSGQPVTQHAVRVSPQLAANAQVLPHPAVTPTRTAEVPRRVTAPRAVQARPPITVANRAPVVARNTPNAPAPIVGYRGPAGAGGASGTRPIPRYQAAGPAGNPQQPLVTRPAPVEPTAPIEGTAGGRSPVYEVQRPQAGVPSAEPQARAPAYARPAPQTPVQTGPPLITRTAPPQSRLPFETRAPAMEIHPGRPLEPQQRENLRAGRPAGPQVDREFPPHPAPMTREAPGPRLPVERPAPQQREAPTR
jgi:hypothetical protein